MYPGPTSVELRGYRDGEDVDWRASQSASSEDAAVLLHCGVLDIRFEGTQRSEILFQRARELAGAVLLGEIDCISGERILAGVQPFPKPRDRVRTYRKLVPPDRVVDAAGIVQREIAIDGVFTAWLAVARPAALELELARDMARDSRRPVLFPGTTCDANTLNVAADMVEASLERGDLTWIQMELVIASAVRRGWMVGVRDVGWDDEYGRVRIFGPPEALEAPRRRAELALLR